VRSCGCFLTGHESVKTTGLDRLYIECDTVKSVDRVWIPEDQHTVSQLLLTRCEVEPDVPYIDVLGTRFTAAEVAGICGRLAASLAALGLARGDRVASVVENSPEAMLLWWGITWAGGVSVPINTAYKGEYLIHQLVDCGAGIIIVQADLADRVQAIAASVPSLRHVVVIGDGPNTFGAAAVHPWHELLSADPAGPANVTPSELATFIYTGGTTGPSKGCMLAHNYHEVLARQIGYCWGRTSADILWTPLPLFHYNAIVTAVLGPLVYGGSSAISGRFSVSNFWPEMNRTGATITSTLGTMAYLLANDTDRPEMPKSGAPEANHSLRLLGAAPLPDSIDRIIKDRFGIDTFSGAYGLTEASLVSWSPPGTVNKPNAAGVINTEYFDVRIFDDNDAELPRNTDGEVVLRPKRAHSMYEGYWGRPEATVEASRNLWFHTGDIGRIDDDDVLFFVDRKADYLRRRGENISSFDVERILMRFDGLADVVVHAVPSEFGEDDLKITATLKEGSVVDEADLFRFCIAELPYFALPRYIEFRSELPRSPVGRVLKRVLRDEGRTASTWCVDDSGITFEKR
jgi:carnitine-CoA ligase